MLYMIGLSSMVRVLTLSMTSGRRDAACAIF